MDGETKTKNLKKSLLKCLSNKCEFLMKTDHERS